ncbi:hypothetical protein [Terrisporobacter sp.]
MEANKILLQKMYVRIIMEFSKQTGKDLMESLDYFYNSYTYDLIKNGVGDMHCRGYRYLADELMLEYGFKYHKGYSR